MLMLHGLDAWLMQLGVLPFAGIDQAILNAGVALSRRHGISCSDAAMVAAAERLGASTFYTEDLNHGQLCGPVRAINPSL